MSSSLLSIAASGASAAQTALEVASQNIANASTDGYVKRSVTQTESISSASANNYNTTTLSGTRVTAITRDVDAYTQSEVRRTGSDAARADTLVTGLTSIDNAVENSGVYDAITSFESSLQSLASDPTDTSTRASALQSATDLAQTFNLASTSLASATTGLQTNASSDVSQVNTLATSLAKINSQIAASPTADNGTDDLLDERDSLLQQLSQLGDVTTTFATNGTVQVQMGGSSGPVLVGQDGSTSTLAMTTATDGTISFTLGSSALTLSGGSLAGEQQALATAATTKTSLDSIAANLIDAANSTQADGVDLNGNTGTDLFSGTGAGDISVALTSGSGLALAASGSAADSSDTTNLTALQTALSDEGISDDTNNLIFNLSSAVSSNTTTQSALDTIYSNAQTTLSSQTGVNLDDEAANLVKYQQAFQASSKVMQVAQTIFEQLLNIN